MSSETATKAAFVGFLATSLQKWICGFQIMMWKVKSQLLHGRWRYWILGFLSMSKDNNHGNRGINNFILVSNKETPAAKTKQTWTFQHAAENQEHYCVILDPGFVLVLQAAKKVFIRNDLTNTSRVRENQLTYMLSLILICFVCFDIKCNSVMKILNDIDKS